MTHTLWGAFPGPAKYPNTNPVETKADMRARTCTALGVPVLPLERVFNDKDTWTIPPGDGVVSFTLDVERTIAGEYDTALANYAAAIDVDAHMWLTINHECDNPDKGINPARQVLAHQHVAEIVYNHRSSELVKMCTINMSYTLSHGGLDQWYPGSDYVDAVGLDAYSRPKGPATADDVFNPCLAYAALRDKKLLICETSMGAVGHGGKYEYPAGSGQYVDIPDSAWLDFVGRMDMLLDGVARGVCWFETNKSDGRWLLEGHTDALTAYAAMAQASL